MAAPKEDAEPRPLDNLETSAGRKWWPSWSLLAGPSTHHATAPLPRDEAPEDEVSEEEASAAPEDDADPRPREDHLDTPDGPATPPPLREDTLDWDSAGDIVSDDEPAVPQPAVLRKLRTPSQDGFWEVEPRPPPAM